MLSGNWYTECTETTYYAILDFVTTSEDAYMSKGSISGLYSEIMAEFKAGSTSLYITHIDNVLSIDLEEPECLDYIDFRVEINPVVTDYSKIRKVVEIDGIEYYEDLLREAKVND